MNSVESKIEVFSDKFSIITENGIIDMGWDEVYCIHYYRSDYIYSTTLTLVFDYSYGEFNEVCDKMLGWNELVDNLEKHIMIQDKDWKKGLEKCEVDDKPVTIYTNPNI